MCWKELGKHLDSNDVLLFSITQWTKVTRSHVRLLALPSWWQTTFVIYHHWTDDKAQGRLARSYLSWAQDQITAYTINQSITFICRYTKVTRGGLSEKPVYSSSSVVRPSYNRISLISVRKHNNSHCYNAENNFKCQLLNFSFHIGRMLKSMHVIVAKYLQQTLWLLSYIL